jgi:hypothetical protein
MEKPRVSPSYSFKSFSLEPILGYEIMAMDGLFC